MQIEHADEVGMKVGEDGKGNRNRGRGAAAADGACLGAAKYV